VAFAAAVAMLPWAGALLLGHTRQLFGKALEQHAGLPSSSRWIADVAGPVLMVLVAASVAAVAVGLVQTGGVIVLRRLSVDLSLRRPNRDGRWRALFRSAVTPVVVCGCAAYVLGKNSAAIVGTLGDPNRALTLSAHLAYDLAWMTALATLGLGLLDWLMVRGAWLQRLMMSRYELRQERKETEGDPEIRAAQRRAYERIVEASALALDRDSTVLVLGGGGRVVALRYVRGVDEAPCVIGRGHGQLGHRMQAAARDRGTAVVSNGELGQALWNLRVGEVIPERLYEPVADALQQVWSKPR
jgi:flagellar biosynthetic protein FlhB